MSDKASVLYFLHKKTKNGRISSRVIMKWVRGLLDPKSNRIYDLTFSKNYFPETREQLEEKRYHEALYNTGLLLCEEYKVRKIRYPVDKRDLKNKQNKKP